MGGGRAQCMSIEQAAHGDNAYLVALPRLPLHAIMRMKAYHELSEPIGVSFLGSLTSGLFRAVGRSCHAYAATQRAHRFSLPAGVRGYGVGCGCLAG